MWYSPLYIFQLTLLSGLSGTLAVWPPRSPTWPASVPSRPNWSTRTPTTTATPGRRTQNWPGEELTFYYYVIFPLIRIHFLFNLFCFVDMYYYYYYLQFFVVTLLLLLCYFSPDPDSLFIQLKERFVSLIFCLNTPVNFCSSMLLNSHTLLRWSCWNKNKVI